MTERLSRRAFTVLGTGALFTSAATGPLSARSLRSGQESPPTQETESADKPKGPQEAAFERDYPVPGFKPSWKKPQLNREFVQDFVIYAHSDLEMVKKLLEKEPALLNATMDWGGGDWEAGLGGASHMGRHDIVEFLLEQGARIDLFCAAMMGELEAIKSYLTLQPNLIDAKGPHGFSLHFHAQVGGDRSAAVLEYLQGIKEVELRPIPFLQKRPKKDG